MSDDWDPNWHSLANSNIDKDAILPSGKGVPQARLELPPRVKTIARSIRVRTGVRYGK